VLHFSVANSQGTQRITAAAAHPVLFLCLNTNTPLTCCCGVTCAATYAANVSMYVYDTNDIVSNELRGTQHAWESSEINQMLWALQQHQHVQQLLISQGKSQAAAVPLMVDIGANIGWWVLPSKYLLCTVAFNSCCSWWFHWQFWMPFHEVKRLGSLLMLRDSVGSNSKRVLPGCAHLLVCTTGSGTAAVNYGSASSSAASCAGSRSTLQLPGHEWWPLKVSHWCNSSNSTLAEKQADDAE
jgi:hypothetical protein